MTSNPLSNAMMFPDGPGYAGQVSDVSPVQTGALNGFSKRDDFC
jgi:hypothetical protein